MTKLYFITQSFEYVFDPEKNIKLKRARGVNFEDVIAAIAQGYFLDIKPHHNPGKYANQEILAVEIDNYIYLTPCSRRGNMLTLKTVYPSRKATLFYLKELLGEQYE